MEAPVDRVENASRNQSVPDRVRRTAESAKEKDDKFTKVLREKMQEDSRHKRKDKKKNNQDELLLSKKIAELADRSEADDEQATQPEEESPGESKAQSDESKSIDLTA